MRREIFKGQEVLSTGRGQCERCKSVIVRVLIDESGGRTWHSAEVGNYGYVPHNCKPSGSAPAKKAA
jgi:hypothetical protein